MRLWTLHPRYLDPPGLVALWREALLAQKVLAGETRGYRHHPQLVRFRACRRPDAAIGAYLWAVADEADRRGYRFDTRKIRRPRSHLALPATSGQLRFEREHLMNKLRKRAAERAEAFARLTRIAPHPLFHIVPGPVAEWERASL